MITQTTYPFDGFLEFLTGTLLAVHSTPLVCAVDIANPGRNNPYIRIFLIIPKQFMRNHLYNSLIFHVIAFFR